MTTTILPHADFPLTIDRQVTSYVIGDTCLAGKVADESGCQMLERRKSGTPQRVAASFE